MLVRCLSSSFVQACPVLPTNNLILVIYVKFVSVKTSAMIIYYIILKLCLLYKNMDALIVKRIDDKYSSIYYDNSIIEGYISLRHLPK